MKLLTASALMLGLLATTVAVGQEDADEPEKKDAAAGSVKERASYGFGYNFGNNLVEQGIPIEVDRFVAGLRDAFAKKESQLTDEQIREAMAAFQQEVQQEQQAAKAAEAEKNKAAGEKFLEANAAREGVKQTESGLQYKVVEEGEGAKPKAADTVKVHYHGTLIDGTVFDSSVERKMPATFPVNAVIKGWTEALQMMKVGGKWRLFIPSDLAYGENPRPGGKIGPNEVLVFDVELLDILDENEK